MCLYWCFTELPKLTGGGGRNRTGVDGFAGRYLNHSVTPPSVPINFAWLCRPLPEPLGHVAVPGSRAPRPRQDRSRYRARDVTAGAIDGVSGPSLS